MTTTTGKSAQNLTAPATITVNKSAIEWALKQFQNDTGQLRALAVTLQRELDLEEDPDGDHTTAWHLSQIMVDLLSSSSFETMLTSMLRKGTSE
jgi:hypothetical protein